MNITLGNEFERRINQKVESGLYSSASEVIREGLRLLFEKDSLNDIKAEILKQEVLKGFHQLEAADTGNTSQKSVDEIFEKAKALHDDKA